LIAGVENLPCFFAIFPPADETHNNFMPGNVNYLKIIAGGGK
jgi:hypothetical protein